MKDIVSSYINALNEPNHRFKSWDHCYKAFGESQDIDYLSLHLSFYLASWGMYRGSCGLLWKDYKIHLPVVEMLLKNKDLRKDRIADSDIPKILKIHGEIRRIYGVTGEGHPISVTDTLFSKILLGTLGCLPAFDRYFNAGFGRNNIRINESNLKSIVSFANDNEGGIKRCQEMCAKDFHRDYPQMKIVDMYFWQLGYDEFQKKKREQVKAAQ